MTTRSDFNQSEYYKDKEEKRKFWIEYAKKVLANPRSTYSECKGAAIGVRIFDPELEQQLQIRKGKPPRY